MVGSSVPLLAIALDASGNRISGPNLSWSSSAPAVATVDANGLVTGQSTGTATITATGSGKTATATVAVANSSSSQGTLHEPSGMTKFFRMDRSIRILDRNGQNPQNG
jgi:lactocepin